MLEPLEQIWAVINYISGGISALSIREDWLVENMYHRNRPH